MHERQGPMQLGTWKHGRHVESLELAYQRMTHGQGKIVRAMRDQEGEFGIK